MGDTFKANIQETNGVDNLQFIFMVSQVTFLPDVQSVKKSCPDFSAEGRHGVYIGVSRASGIKCDRCWYYTDDIGEDPEHSTVCPRCAAAVKADGHVVSASRSSE